MKTTRIEGETGHEALDCVVSGRVAKAARRECVLGAGERHTLSTHLAEGCDACFEVLGELDDEGVRSLLAQTTPDEAVGERYSEDRARSAARRGLDARQRDGVPDEASTVDDAWFDAVASLDGSSAGGDAVEIANDATAARVVRPPLFEDLRRRIREVFDVHARRQSAGLTWVQWSVAGAAAAALVVVVASSGPATSPAEPEIQARGAETRAGVALDLSRWIATGEGSPVLSGDVVPSGTPLAATWTNPSGAYRHLTLVARDASGTWHNLSEAMAIGAVGVDEDGPRLGPIPTELPAGRATICGLFSQAPPDQAKVEGAKALAAALGDTICSEITIGAVKP